MRTLIKGKIEDFTPIFNGFVNERGILILREDGNLSLTIDTGFSGCVALPENILRKMNLKLIDFVIFILANGNEIELPVFWGKVMINDEEIKTWFIPGDFLLGMEFFSLVGNFLSFDFKKKEVKLM